jgi:DnaK suppressor protein
MQDSPTRSEELQPVDTQASRDQLEQMLREIESTTAALEGEGAGESSELTTQTQHPAEVGSDLADTDREQALLDAEDTRRTEIEAALKRIDEGAYGRCIDCGKEIPAARLEVRPEAARCIEDQEKFEADQA